MLRRVLALLAFTWLASGCRFTIDRTLAPGDLRGRVVLTETNGQVLPAAGAKITLSGTRLTTGADQQGYFVIHGLTPASYSLRIAYQVSADGKDGLGLVVPHITLDEKSGRSLDIGTVVLQHLARLRGVAQLDGAPAAGAQVSLPGAGSQFADSDGTFAFEGLFPIQSSNSAVPPQVTAFVPREDGVLSSTVPYQLTAGQETDVHISIDAPAAPTSPAPVSGLVRRINAAAAAGTTVRLVGADGSPAAPDVQTSADGSFNFAAVPAGTYAVVASANSYQDLHYPFVVVAGQPVVLPELVLTAADGRCGLGANASATCDAPEPLFVTSATPTIGQKDVSFDAVLSVTFQKAVDAASATSDTVQLLDASGLAVLGNVSASSQTVGFMPQQSLSPSATYTLRVSTGVRAQDGTSLLTELRITFTTAVGFVVVSSTPPGGATGIASTVHPTVQFSLPIDPASVSTTTVQLGTPDGETVTGSPSADGATLTFVPDQPLANAEAYLLQLGAGLRSVSGLSLSQDVFIQFTTAPPDIFTVVDTDPGSNTYGNPVSIMPSVQFSKSIDMASVAGRVHLYDANSAEVAGTTNVSGATIRFTPTAPLSTASLYTFQIDAGLRASTGETLAQSVVVPFNTVNPAPLAITSSTPTDMQTDVPVDQLIRVTFNGPLPMMVSAGTVTLMDAMQNPVSGQITTNGDTLTFTPDAALATNTQYVLQFAPSFQSLDERVLMSARSLTFTTTMGTSF